MLDLLVLIFLCFLTIPLFNAPPVEKAHAATQTEILEQAKTNYAAARDVVKVISEAVDAAQKRGIGLEEIALLHWQRFSW
jgi:ribosomal protein L22